MDLGRYPSEVKAIADELLELLQREYSNDASRILTIHGAASFNSCSECELDTAIKFLSQTPSQRSRKLNRMPKEEACLLILRARYIGLAAAQAMHFADRFEMVPGQSYRGAAAFAAREVSRARFFPNADEVFPVRSQWPADEQFLERREREEWSLHDD